MQGRRLFGRSAEADMLVEVTLYDPTGNVITRNGTARSVRDEFPAVGTDARIRYVVPTSGRYTISVTGEAGRFGDPAHPD